MTHRVLNTRPKSQAAELSKLLRQNSYEPVEVPLVELVLLSEELAALSKLPASDYDGILLSSPNLLQLINALGKNSILQPLLSKPWYLISNRARVQVESLGAKVRFCPREASLEGFLKEFPPQKNLRLLHPCSQATRLDLHSFSKLGVAIQNFPVYAPHCPEGIASALQAAWPEVQTVLFASGSAVHNLFAIVPALGQTLVSSTGPLPISIGPSATEALQAAGVRKFQQAESADNAGFVAVLNLAFNKPKGNT